MELNLFWWAENLIGKGSMHTKNINVEIITFNPCRVSILFVRYSSILYVSSYCEVVVRPRQEMKIPAYKDDSALTTVQLQQTFQQFQHNR